MRRWFTVPAVLVLGLFSQLSLAADGPGPLSRSEIIELASDKNIKLKMNKLTEAINQSNFDWAYEDAYALVDLEMPPDIIQLASGKAGMFYTGNERSLNKIARDGRESAPAQTIKLGDSDFVVLFETFNDLKYEEAAVRDNIGAFPPREKFETDDAFFLRKRKYDEKLLAALSPIEGKIDKLSFEATLTGSYTPYDGSCTQGHIDLDLDKIDFDLFRYALGGRRVIVPITVLDSNVPLAQFEAGKRRRFEAKSKPICVSSGAASSLLSQGSKLKITFSRAHDANVWTGTGTFTNARTGGKL